MCKNYLKHICSISVVFATRSNILLNCAASLSRDIIILFSIPTLILFYFCLSLNIQSKTASGKEPCRLPEQWANKSCAKNSLPAHLMKMKICVQLLFWVLIQEHRYPKLRRVLGLSSLCGKRAAFPCLALNLWPLMLQVSCWTEQAFEPAEVDSDPVCSSLAQAMFSATYRWFLYTEEQMPQAPQVFHFPMHALLSAPH